MAQDAGQQSEPLDVDPELAQDQEDESEGPSKRSSVWPWILLAIVVLVVILLLWLYWRQPNQGTVTVIKKTSEIPIVTTEPRPEPIVPGAPAETIEASSTRTRSRCSRQAAQRCRGVAARGRLRRERVTGVPGLQGLGVRGRAESGRRAAARGGSHGLDRGRSQRRGGRRGADAQRRGALRELRPSQGRGRRTEARTCVWAVEQARGHGHQPVAAAGGVHAAGQRSRTSSCSSTPSRPRLKVVADTGCHTLALSSAQEVRLVYAESDPKALRVLEFSLGSSNRVLRLRAVCMLSRVSCDQREQWLAAACGDSDPAVSETAMSVMAWTLQPDSPPWPQREDPTFDRIPQLVEPEESLDAVSRSALGVGVRGRGVARGRAPRGRVPLHDVPGGRRARQADRARSGGPGQHEADRRPLRAVDCRSVHSRQTQNPPRRTSFSAQVARSVK